MYKRGGTYDYSYNVEVKNCTILHARYGIYLDNISNAHVHYNDIQPGSDADNNAHAYGIYISSLGDTNRAHIYNNRIHNLRNGYHTSFPTVAAIESHPSSEAYIYNNFIYDFTVPNAEIHAVHIGTGTDFDGDLRDDPCDIGADEYDVAPAGVVTNLTVYRETGTDNMILRRTEAPNANSYKIYAGDAPDFVVGPATYLGATGNTTYIHTGYYSDSREEILCGIGVIISSPACSAAADRKP